MFACLLVCRDDGVDDGDDDGDDDGVDDGVDDGDDDGDDDGGTRIIVGNKPTTIKID